MQFASATISFAGNPEFGQITSVNLAGTLIQHVNLISDTAETIALCFALLINAGSNSVRAEADGTVLTITARSLGTAGNGLTISAITNNSPANSTPLTAQASGRRSRVESTVRAPTPMEVIGARIWQPRLRLIVQRAIGASLSLRH
jgi:phage tail sheath gpL-like